MQKLLNTTSRMMLTLGFNVRLMSFFRRCVVAKPMRFSVDSDVGAPFVLKPNDTQKSRLVALVGAMNILRVAVWPNNAQIAQSVVVFAPVNVVNQSVRPYAMHVQPRQTMRFINATSKTYRNVTKFVLGACYISDMHGFSRALFPRHHSGVLVVVQKLTNFFRCNIAFGHKVLLLKGPNLSTETTK